MGDVRVPELNKYKSRIVGSGDEPLDQIMFNPRNWRIHPLNQQNALKGVLEEVGWVQQVIVNKRTGNLIDGHLRCQLAAREGNETIPVTYVDLSDEEEALVLSTLDPIAGMAATDKEKLDDLFRQFNSDNENVQKLIGEIADKEKLEYGKKPIEDVEPQIDKVEELRVKWGVETGQLWKLGECRLICGDCTDRAVVERVMGGEKADMVYADPPYGMNLDTDFEERSKRSNKVNGNNYPKVIGDNNAFDMKRVFDSEIKEQFWWGADYYHKELPDCGSWFVWDKRCEKIDNAPGNMFELCWSHVHHRCEIIRILWSGLTAKEINESRYHPTQKPIELAVHFIGRYSVENAIIYDPFLGSGTTIIACERLGRKCCAIEISPAYVAVSIQRWVDATGGTPELLTD